NAKPATGFPSRITSVITATTEVVISEKSMEEFFSVEFSAMEVSRMSVMRMGSLWLGHDDAAFGLADVLDGVRSHRASNRRRSSLDEALNELAIRRMNARVTVVEVIGRCRLVRVKLVALARRKHVHRHPQGRSFGYHFVDIRIGQV